MSKARPTVLYVGCDYTEHQPEEWTKFTNHFNVIIYDCPSVDEFIRRMTPGEEYSNIDAIMRPSWLKAPPFQHQHLFRGKSVDHYPPSLKIIVSGGHGYDVVDVERIAARGIVFCNSPNTCTEATGKRYLRGMTEDSELCDLSYSKFISIFHLRRTMREDRRIRSIATIKSHCGRPIRTNSRNNRSRRHRPGNSSKSLGLRNAHPLLFPHPQTSI